MIVYKPLVLSAGFVLAGLSLAQACPTMASSPAEPSAVEQAQSDNLPRPMAATPGTSVVHQQVDVTTVTRAREPAEVDDMLSTGSLGRR